MKWHAAPPSVSDHHFQGDVRHSSPNSPAIIINAAAAAASGRPYESHRTESHPYPDIDSVEIVHRKPPRLQPIESSTEEEEEEEEEGDLDELDDDSAFHNDQGDFFVLRRNRKRQRKTDKHRGKQRNRHQENRSRERHRPNPYSRHRNKVKHKQEYIDDDFEDYLERKSFSLEPRSLGSTESDADGVEGDVFQYEDFDFEPDNVYADSESSESQNSSGTSAAKERNTPDGLRHRRIYTKWSRWSKCSPKCTTRRYK